MTDNLPRAKIEAILHRHYGEETVLDTVQMLNATNLVYRVDTPSGQVILKVYDRRLDLATVKQEVILLRHLWNKEYPHPELRATMGGEWLCLTGDGRPATLSRFVEGREVTIPPIEAAQTQFGQAGSALAELHLASAGCPLERTLSGPEDTLLMLKELEASPDSPQAFVARTLKRYHDLMERPMWDCPRGVIHGDLTREHVLFAKDGEEVLAILDYEWAGQGHLVQDLATAATFWTFDGGACDTRGLRAMIGGYHAVRELTPLEQVSFVDFMVYATLYWAVWRCHWTTLVHEGVTHLDYREKETQGRHVETHRAELTRAIEQALAS